MIKIIGFRFTKNIFLSPSSFSWNTSAKLGNGFSKHRFIKTSMYWCLVSTLAKDRSQKQEDLPGTELCVHEHIAMCQFVRNASLNTYIYNILYYEKGSLYKKNTSQNKANINKLVGDFRNTKLSNIFVVLQALDRNCSK